MKSFFQKSGGLLLIIAMLLTILVGAGSVLIQGSTDPITNAMGVVTTPFRMISSSIADFGEGVHAFLVNYDQLDEKVAELELEIARLETITREGDAALKENARLRELLSLSAKKKDFVFESAYITNKSFTGWESAFTLDKGAKQGLEENDCVITEEGHLVGVVTDLGETWCTVSTVISTDISMGGVVARTSSAGLLEGEFSLMAYGLLQLSYLPEEAQIVAGDQVVTSGLGEIYPEGLTVGKIQGVFNDSAGISRYAVVEPNVDLNQLTQVFVIKDFEIIN